MALLATILVVLGVCIVRIMKPKSIVYHKICCKGLVGHGDRKYNL